MLEYDASGDFLTEAVFRTEPTELPAELDVVRFFGACVSMQEAPRAREVDRYPSASLPLSWHLSMPVNQEREIAHRTLPEELTAGGNGNNPRHL